MNSRRMAKASEAIRETVSTVVLFNLRDPRIKNVTVLSADVSPDLRAAKIYVSVMGDAKAQTLAMHGLDSARGFIQSKIADRLQTKNTPLIRFILDPSVKKSIEVSRALQEANQIDEAFRAENGQQGELPADSDELESDEEASVDDVPNDTPEESASDHSTGA